MAALLLLIISLSTLIIVHELGHFYSARLLRIRVEEFGFGFPPRVFSRVKKGIRYSLNALPFGGFVKIYGESGEGESSPDSFTSRPAHQRLLVLAAGVLMNLAAAWVLFSFGAAIGSPDVADGHKDGVPISIIGVLPNSPAEHAGLRFGDKIMRLKSSEMDMRVVSEKDVIDFADAFRGEDVTLIIKRGGNTEEIKVVPRVSAPSGQGPIGIVMGQLITTRVPWYWAPISGAMSVWSSLKEIVIGLGSMIRELMLHGASEVPVAGPVGIYFFGRDVQRLGLAYVLQFVGMLSVNLAVLNALPIPALDGGRMFFIILEKIKGRRISATIEQYAHTVGFALLIILMALVTYKDIVNIL